MEKNPNKAAPSAANQFQKNVLDTLYGNLPKTVFVGVSISLVLAAALWEALPPTWFVGWIGCIIFGSIIRLSIRRLYFKDYERYSSDTWISLYHYSSLFVGVSWGSISFMLINRLIPSEEGLLVAVLIGFMTGGAVANIAIKKTAYGYTLACMVPYIVKISIEAQYNYEWFILCIIIFNFFIFQVVSVINKIFYDSLQNAEDKEQLLNEVKGKLELQEELEQEKLKALQSSKLASLGEMAAGIAHEINNPLTIGLGNLQVLKNMAAKGNYDEGKFVKQLEGVVGSCRRVADIVQSMRNLSRMREDVELQEFTLSSLVEIVKPLFETKLKNGDVKFIDEMVDFKIVADKGEVSQVLLNLINNANDAIADQEKDKWIQLTSERKGDQVFLRITDSGEELTEEMAHKIFQPFFTTKEVGKGTGLGLSLSKTIMTRNQGDLEFDSSFCNTTFVMVFKAV